mgnify:FL=1
MIMIQEKTAHSIKNLAIQYKKFPLVNSSIVFLNTLSLEVPVFFLAKYFSMEMVGLYMLANRISVIPMSLFGTSVTKVYFQKATDTFNHKPEQLLNVYKKTVQRLAGIGLVPFLSIFLFAPFFMKLIFGNEWQFSGVIIQILAIGMFMQFTTSPISTTLTIMNKQEIALYLTVFSLVVRFSTMFLFRHNIGQMLWALSISTAIFYLFYNYFIMLTIKKSIKI